MSSGSLKARELFKQGKVQGHWACSLYIWSLLQIPVGQSKESDLAWKLTKFSSIPIRKMNADYIYRILPITVLLSDSFYSIRSPSFIFRTCSLLEYSESKFLPLIVDQNNFKIRTQCKQNKDLTKQVRLISATKQRLVFQPNLNKIKNCGATEQISTITDSRSRTMAI